MRAITAAASVILLGAAGAETTTITITITQEITMGAWLAQRTRWSHWDEARITKLRQALRRPGRKLVLQHFDKRHEFRISPDNIQVRSSDAEVLIRRKYVVEFDRGLFDTPQTWTCL